MRDDAKQAHAAEEIMSRADGIAVTVSTLCELCWVLSKVYRLSSAEIALAIRTLYLTTKVKMDRLAVDAGLAIIDAGGDFADGAIAYEGRWLGGDTLVSFDKKAVKLIADQGHFSLLLNP